jgi:hypothetical protein
VRLAPTKKANEITFFFLFGTADGRVFAFPRHGQPGCRFDGWGSFRFAYPGSANA